MKRPHPAWCLLVALLALAPAGLRMLSWRPPRPEPVDAQMAEAGQVLFQHEWTPKDPLANGGDGLGPVYNANSCLACHNQGGPGGGGDVRHNVTTFTVQSRGDRAPVREGVVHAYGIGTQETLANVNSSLPPIARPTLGQLVRLTTPAPMGGACPSGGSRVSFPSGVHISQRNTPALFGAKLIDEIPDRVLIAAERAQRVRWGMAPAKLEDVPVGRALRLANGRVGKFGWKAQTATLSDFVQAACANELGLGNPGQVQPRPMSKPSYQAPGIDLTLEQCDQITAFVGSLPQPTEQLPADAAGRSRAEHGKQLFSRVGCADCHTPTVGSVDGIYSDLLLHRMGRDMEGGGSYNEPPPNMPPESTPGDGSQPDEWKTPPLWGVADSAPYLHDGRAATLEDAIRLHAGQAARSARNFIQLNPGEQAQLVSFLKTLRAP